MRFLRYLILFCIAVIGGTVSAQSQRELGQLMRERNEYYFTLRIDDLTEIQIINRICSVDGTDGRTVVAYANQQEYDKLLQAGYQPILQTPPSLREEAVMWDGNRATYEWDSYPTYSQYVSMMQSFPASAVSGRTCTYIELGTLSSGRKIMGVRINNGSPEGKPKFLYSSTIHGDETTGWIMQLRLIDELCTSTDSRIVNLVDNLDIYIFPNTNPDGTYYSGNNSVTGSRRYNANGVDLNRHFKDFVNGDHPDGASSYELEAQWMMNLGLANLFTMGANYHGGAELMNYPYDCTRTYPADTDWWELVCTEYVTLARQVYSSYMTSNYPDGVTNGAAWYMIGGGRQDFMNYYAECREVTIECSSTKTLNASQLPSYWNYNHNSMLTLMEQCLNGIHGFVYDATTEQPIVGATITVLNHDSNNSHVTSHDAGDFHRPIKGGSWTIAISKEGYCSQTVDVNVSDNQRVDLDVYLYPIGECPAICFEQVIPTAAGTYIMGYLNDTTLVMPTHNSSSTVTTTSATVTLTDNGFSALEYLPHVMLTAYGSNGQYYIQYNGRYLARNNLGNLTWSSSTPNQNGRWYINNNGIYVTQSNSNYYLYYYNNSFRLSTTQQNNITFYTEGDCPPQPIQQMTTLHQGWNWWSTNLDITLSDFETALGTSGINILSQGNGSVDYMYNAWEGDFSELDFAKMYEVNVAELVEMTLSGVAIDPTQLTITLNPNWNWIGYPVQTSMDVNNALSDLSPAIGDIIKSKNSGVSMYTGSSWIGVLDSLQPGQGYMYYSTATGTKTFTYPANGRGLAKVNVRSENNRWKPVSDRFANNMTVLAVVDLEGHEAVDESIEVGAFVGDECRGSVRLMHVDATGRYMAFMTVHGESGELVSFKVLDGDVEREVRETLEFRVNGIFGDLNTPYVLHIEGNNLVLFPNPVERGKAISLDMPAGSELNDVKVEVYNTLGSLVRSEILNGVATLNGLPTAGIYSVKVTERNGNIHFAKLVVR